MSSDWWANMIGTASNATTPSGSVPNYGMAADIGMGPWPTAQAFNAWAEDEVKRTRSQDIQRVQQAKDQAQESNFHKVMGFLGGVLKNAYGDVLNTGSSAAGGSYALYARRAKEQGRPVMPEDEWNGLDRQEQNAQLSSTGGQHLMETPGVKQAMVGLSAGYKGLATAPLAVGVGIDEGGWSAPIDLFKGSTWAKAWALADTRSPGEAMVDLTMRQGRYIVNPFDPWHQNDLDRIQRTNSLVGISSFASDLAIGMKFDPTVLVGKGVGEAAAIRNGVLPQAGSLGKRVADEALIAARSGEKIDSLNPKARYGNWRGRRINSSFDQLRALATDLDYADFVNLPMFRRRATNGPQLALAFKVAAKDDRLWDLTQRAALADPDAWATIAQMNRTDIPQELKAFAGSDAGTFIDALNATRTTQQKLEGEVNDLQAQVDKRLAQDGRTPYVPDVPAATKLDDAFGGYMARPGTPAGFYRYYTKELQQDLAMRQADLEAVNTALGKYGDDYATWLDAVPSSDRPTSTIEQVSTRGPSDRLLSYDFLTRRTYQQNVFGPAHSVYGITKSGFIKEANPIDLHRAESGVESIRRQFEGFHRYFGYVDREGLNKSLEAFTRASVQGDHKKAFEIAQAIEDEHLGKAISQWSAKFDKRSPEELGDFGPGLDPATVKLFMDRVRGKRDQMTRALLSGDGAVYSTAPNAMSTAKVLEVLPDGSRRIEITDGAQKHTLVVPEVALKQGLAVDPTQTPNFYTPMNTREVFLAFKRDPELFELLDNEVRAGAAKYAGKVMESIDELGGKWNKFWKPLQLFRLAWPQRVLMDESIRGMALLGAHTWIKEYGNALRIASMNAVNPYEHPGTMPGLAGAMAGFTTGAAVGGPFVGLAAGAVGTLAGVLPRAIERRRMLKMGPGPVTDRLAGRVGTADHQAMVESAPAVPEYYAPKVNPKRARVLDTLVAEMDATNTHNVRVSALSRAMDRERNDFFRAMGTHGRVIHTQGKYVRDAEASVAGFEYYDLPINRALHDFRADTGVLPYQTQMPRMANRAVYDPIDGKQAKSGYAIPVASKELRHEVPALQFRDPERGHPTTAGSLQHDLNDFIMAHRELLSSGGYRIQFHRPDAEKPQIIASIVRVFRKGELDKAADFAGHVGVDEFSSIHEGHQLYVRDWNAQSPIMEELTRRFASEEETARIPGEAPALDPEGNPIGHVNHGSARPGGLPDELLPRDLVPVDRANMYGPGFYTTVSDDLGGTYDYGSGLYTIRGAKDGKTYKTFDLEQDLTPEDAAKLRARFEAWRDEQARLLREDGKENDAYWTEQETNDFLLEVDNATRPGWRPKWRDLYEAIHDDPYSGRPRINVELTRFLEEEKQAGVLHHVGGVFTGGERHHVYIWLKPEELIVRPVYDKTGKFYSVEEWFSHPDSQERLFNQVPENRIIRTGKRLPPLRELETVHNRRMAFEKDWHANRAKGVSSKAEAGQTLWDQPEYDKLLRAEQDLMHRLGLEYTHNIESLNKRKGTNHQPSNHWWTQVDETRVGHELMAPAVSGDLRRVEREAMDMAELDDVDFNIHIDSVHDAFKRRLLKRREYGTGYMKFKTRDGKSQVVQKALEGPGANYTYLISGAPAYSRLIDNYKRTLSYYQSKAVGYKPIRPPDVTPEALRTTAGRQAAAEYYTAWGDLLNDQVRNSPIWFKMLDGQTDDQIVHWLRNTPEGARLRRELPHKGYDPERWVEEHRQALDFYLPDANLQAALRQGKLKPSELRRIPQEKMPEVFGPDLEMIDGSKGWGKEIGAITDKIYHALGTVPTDLLSRQPFFKSMYDLKMRSLIRTAKSEQLTNDILAGYEKLSREFALRQVKRTMYGLADDTNFTQALRFLAPFWGAQQEAMVKWASILMEKPETLARFYVGINSVYNNFQVVDEDGRPVKGPLSALGYNPNHRVILQIPKSLMKVPPFDKFLAGGDFTHVGISFGSANTALQGENFFLPSLGPLVTMPADKLVNAMWDTHGTQFDQNFFYRWLFPVGRPSAGAEGFMEQILPGWGRRMMQIQDGQDSTSYANTYFSVMREMTLDHKKRGIAPPTPEEIQNAVSWHYALRVVAAFGAPTQMEFRPKHQFWLDAYHEMIRQYGPADAFDKFVQKYGADAARYAASSSTSIVPPTAGGMAEWHNEKQLIAKYPDWASAMISPDAWSEDFSSDAYKAQFDVKLGPGTNKTIRQAQDPYERAKQTDIRVGWLKYRQVMSAINAELFNRGLTSLQSTQAADLKAIKDQWVASYRQKNPSWSDDFDTFDNTIYGRIRDLRQWVYNKRFDNRPDIQGVRQYLVIRDSVGQSLEQYHAETGGSRSLQAQENTNLRNWFYDQVGQLIQANPAFGEFYTRYLDADRLERGMG